MTFTKAQLRTLYGIVARALPPGGRPLTSPAEIVEANALLERIAEMIADKSAESERGVRVLEWRLPRDLAPTLNEYGFLAPWRRTKMRSELDTWLRRTFDAHPRAELLGTPKRRWVRLTRFSTKPVDELAVDILGGKMPIDSLVRCGVLVDDSPKWLHREPVWTPTERGNTHVTVEVFELANEEAAVSNPVGATAPKTEPRKRTAISAYLFGDGEGR